MFTEKYNKKYTSDEVKSFIGKPLFEEKSVYSEDPSYPKISIIIPSFNQAQFLEKTILSVLNQNYPNLELIIIDGGSTDGSVEIIKKYERYLNYWISEKDNGQAAAITKGCKMSKGDLIAWQNSDDLYLPNALFGVAQIFKKNSKVDLIFGNNYLIDSDDNIIKKQRYIPFSLEHLLYCGWNLSSQATFWNRNIMNKVGYLKNLHVLFDFDWFIRLGKASKNIEFKADFWGCYRIHEESKFSLVSKKSRWPLFVNILKKHGVEIKEDIAWDKQFRVKKLKIKLRWFFHHLMQGEVDYVLKALLRRRSFLSKYDIRLGNEKIETLSHSKHNNTL